MSRLAVPLLSVFALLVTPAAVASAQADSPEAAAEAVEAIYRRAAQTNFYDAATMNELAAACEAFLADYPEAPFRLKAAVRTYRCRCWMRAGRNADVMAETLAVLRDDADVSAGTRVRAWYYRGEAAIAVGNREAADEARESIDRIAGADGEGADLARYCAPRLRSAYLREWPPIVAGEPVPDWTLPTLYGHDHGETLTLSSLRGQWVLLDFWATWCGPCVRTMDSHMQPLHLTYGNSGQFRMISVGCAWKHETIEKELQYIAETGYTWTKVFDENREVTDAWGIVGIPTLTLIDPDGTVVCHGNTRETLPVILETLALELTPNDMDPAVEVFVEQTGSYYAAHTARFGNSELNQAAIDPSVRYLLMRGASDDAHRVRTVRTRLCTLWAAEERGTETVALSGVLLEDPELCDRDRATVLLARGRGFVALDDRESAEGVLAELEAQRAGMARFNASYLRNDILTRWNPLEVGSLPPQWSLPRMNADGPSGELSLESLRGRHTLLVFWASLNGDARNLISGELAGLYSEHGGDAFELVTIGTMWGRDSTQSQQAFLAGIGATWLAVSDSDAAVRQRYNCRQIPFLVWLAADGTVLAAGGVGEVMPAVRGACGR